MKTISLELIQTLGIFLCFHSYRQIHSSWALVTIKLKKFSQLQETAKDTLKKLVDEKLETVKRMSDIERSLSNTEDEYSTLKELYDREVEENRKLAEEISRY